MRPVSTAETLNGRIANRHISSVPTQAALTMLAFLLVSPATARTRTPDAAPNQPIETTICAVSASFRRRGVIGRPLLFAVSERVTQPREAEWTGGHTLESGVLHQGHGSIENLFLAAMEEGDGVEQPPRPTSFGELDDQHTAAGLHHTPHLVDCPAARLLGKVV